MDNEQNETRYKRRTTGNGGREIKVQQEDADTTIMQKSLDWKADVKMKSGTARNRKSELAQRKANDGHHRSIFSSTCEMRS